jgi:hypothetical protein
LRDFAMRTASISATVLLVVLSVAANPARGAIVVGGEFQVNTYTTDIQRAPSLAMDSDGDFVVVWESQNQDGSARGVFARRFGSSSAALAVEFQVNSYTTGQQNAPSIAMNAGGDFLVVWVSYQDGSMRGIVGHRFSSSGDAVGAEFQVNTRTISSQNQPTAALGDDGGFAVAWSSFQDGGSYGVFASRFSSDAALLGVEFQVNTYTTVNQILPAIALAGSGDFVVSWASSGQDGSDFGIFAQRFSSSGAPQGGEFQVNAYTGGSQYLPAVGTTAEGGFVVAWQSPRDGSTRGIFARRFTSTGAALGEEFKVNLTTADEATRARIATNASGDFIVAWHGGPYGSHYDAFARRFTRTGAALGGELRVNTTTSLPQIEPSPAMAGGRFAVAWASVQQDGPQSGNVGVFAQRFSAPLLDVDGDGEVVPLTDGLLVLRHRFGFTGAALITGAIDVANCSRCTAPAIEAYLAAIEPLLDVDGDEQVEPLTDGLLVLRGAFGFTGTALSTGVVDLDDCTRCSADALLAHLATLGP